MSAKPAKIIKDYPRIVMEEPRFRPNIDKLGSIVPKQHI